MTSLTWDLCSSVLLLSVYFFFFSETRLHFRSSGSADCLASLTEPEWRKTRCPRLKNTQNNPERVGLWGICTRLNDNNVCLLLPPSLCTRVTLILSRCQVFQVPLVPESAQITLTSGKMLSRCSRGVASRARRAHRLRGIQTDPRPQTPQSPLIRVYSTQLGLASVLLCSL